MTNYTHIWTYEDAGHSQPHDDINDCCAWLAQHLDYDTTNMVVEIEYNENGERVGTKDITKAVAEKLADDWRNSETVMTENPNALAETVISIDTVRYELRNEG